MTLQAHHSGGGFEESFTKQKLGGRMAIWGRAVPAAELKRLEKEWRKKKSIRKEKRAMRERQLQSQRGKRGQRKGGK